MGIPPCICAANVHSRPARQECATYIHGPTQIHLNRWSLFAFIFNMQDFFKSVTLFAKYFSKYFFFFLAALRKSVFPAAGSRHIAFDIVLSRRAARNIRTKSLQNYYAKKNKKVRFFCKKFYIFLQHFCTKKRRQSRLITTCK